VNIQTWFSLCDVFNFETEFLAAISRIKKRDIGRTRLFKPTSSKIRGGDSVLCTVFRKNLILSPKREGDLLIYRSSSWSRLRGSELCPCDQISSERYRDSIIRGTRRDCGKKETKSSDVR